MNDSSVQLEGVVSKAHPAAMFEVEFSNGHSALCYLAGKIRKNRVKVLEGDRVVVELSVYDLTKGRITYRYK